MPDSPRGTRVNARTGDQGVARAALIAVVAVVVLALAIGAFFGFRGSSAPAATSGTSGTTKGAAGASAVRVAGSLAPLTAGRGARVPFIEQQAEYAATDGAVLDKDLTAGSLAGEAVGRRAVTLKDKGQYVEFTLTQPANSIDVRYSIPDSADGSDYTAKLALYVDGTKLQDLALTNRYSWYYGTFPFINSPAAGPHHFYDETHALLGKDLPAGAKVRLQVDADDTASSYTIDLADFEQVAPAAPQPGDSVSIVDLGADATGAADSTKALQDAVAQGAATGKTVWIPAGTFQVNGHVSVNNVTITGAGPWRSVLTGKGIGLYGKTAPSGSTNVHLSGFAIEGTVNERVDSAQVNGIGGAIGGGSTISDLWIEHTKVGMWLDGPFSGLTISGTRINDTTADGINLHQGVEKTTITGNFIRNTGDDAIATWSDKDADRGNVITFNTIEVPLLANGIAVYGGADNTVSDNVIADVQVDGGGVHVANRFKSTPLAGTTTVERDTVLRAAGVDSGTGVGDGALWFWALDDDMTGTIAVKDVALIDSGYEAVHFKGTSIKNVTLDGVTIDGTGTQAVLAESSGSATFSKLTATALGTGGSNAKCTGVDFTFTDGGGNTGWDTQNCETARSAVLTYAEPAAAGAADFSLALDAPAASVVAGQSATATLWTALTAGAGDALALTAAGAPDGVTVTFASPALTAGGHTAVTVATTATAAPGQYHLSISAKGSAQTHAADLALTVGTAGSWALTADPAVLALPSTAAGSASAPQTVTVRNTGTDTVALDPVATSGDFTATSDCGQTLAAGASCAVAVTFRPSAAGARGGRLSVTGTAAPLRVALTGSATANASANLAIGKNATSTGDQDGFPPTNATDGNTSSYWESTNKKFPQSITIDLGETSAFSKVVLKLPPPSDWTTRDETVAVLLSTDGTTFTVAKAAAPYRLDPAKANTATITLAPTKARFVRLTVSGNTAWPAAQLAEVEILK